MASGSGFTRRSRRLGTLAAALISLAALAVPASAAEPQEVAAAGNPFTGGLAFEPAKVEIAVGQTVRWTNTDFFAPHTATEDHGLWDLGGTYGATPFTPSGFGPGDSVERRFEAGSWDYYCRVHGSVQSGEVDVPVSVRSRTTKARNGEPRYAVSARWSRTTPLAGQAFDVQIRRKSGWRLVREDTDERSMRSGGLRKGVELDFRARVQRTDEPEARSGWSPPASITTG